MTASDGRPSRQQVRHGGRVVPGLYERRAHGGPVAFEMRVQIDGRRTRKTLRAQTATDAVREQRALLAKLDAGAPLVTRSDLSLRELREEWAEWANSPAVTLARRPLEGYVQRLDVYVLPLLGPETKAASVTPAQLRTMIDRLRSTRGDRGQLLSGSTIRGCVNATSSLLRLGVRHGHLAANPVRSLERGDRPSAKGNREPRYLARPEIDRLLAKLRPDARALAATMAFAGRRVSETLDIRWRDLDFESAVVRVQGTKTEGSRADVPMIAPLTAELLGHRARRPGVGDALVFRTTSGRRLDRKDVLRSIYAAGEAPGLNAKGQKRVGCHDLRHSCAAVLFAAGLPATKVAAVLRHTTTRTTLAVYAGLAEADRSDLRQDVERAFS